MKVTTIEVGPDINLEMSSKEARDLFSFLVIATRYSPLVARISLEKVRTVEEIYKQLGDAIS